MRTVVQILAIGNESVLGDLLNEILGCLKIPYPVQLIIFMNLFLQEFPSSPMVYS